MRAFRRSSRAWRPAALAGRPALVRLPLNGFGLGAQALDIGAAGLVAPMINDAADARAFVEAVKFPPLGRRSWGPVRAMDLLGLDKARYLAEANRLTLALAMIETERGLEMSRRSSRRRASTACSSGRTTSACR